jgi:hypothetical protein
MLTPLDYALRSAITQCTASSTTPTDLEDCADLAALTGASGVEDAFRQIAHLLRGFAPETAGRQTAPAAAINRAVTELRNLMQSCPDEGGPYTGEQSEAPVRSDAVSQPGSLLLLPEAYVSAIETEDSERLAQLIAVTSALLPVAKAPVALDGAMSLAELADAVIGHHLQIFLESNFALHQPPFGSPALLIAAARLSHGALGPYLSGVGRLLQRASDLFGFVALAAQGVGSVDLERWLIVLASKLNRHHKHDLIDDLADRGRVDALRGVYEIERQGSSCSDSVLRQIRDAALDLGDLALATNAQSRLVELSLYSVHERVVLAEIYGTSGAPEPALDALQTAQKLDALDQQTLSRIDALRSNKFERYHVNWGYHSTARQISLRSKNRISH